MGRAPCCDKDGLKKGPWTADEDQKLVNYIQKHGYGNWRTLPKNAGLERCGKSCRLRWINYLRPDIKRGKFSFQEEETIIQLHSILGNKWSAIAARLPGRTDNEIKNYWNTRIRKRLLRMGIDPVTHAPRLDLLDLSSILNPNLRVMLGNAQTLINPEILRLASLLSTQQRDPSYIFQENQIQQQMIQTELQDTSVQELSACVPQPMQPNNVEHHGYAPMSNNNSESYYYIPEQENFLNHLPENSYASVLSSSTSSSSISTPVNSNSPLPHGGLSIEDERESYNSGLLNYESVADFLDMNSCNEIQQLMAESEFPAGPWSIQ